MEHFFPQIQVKTKKKKVFTRNGTGNADVDHTQTIWGDAVKLLGGYIPPPLPGFRHPWIGNSKNIRTSQCLYYCTQKH